MTTRYYKIAATLILSFAISPMILNAQIILEPPPPMDGPPCWPPPCVPVDGGILIAVGAAVLFGIKTIYSSNKNKNK